jgi:hypothetical protein
MLFGLDVRKNAFLALAMAAIALTAASGSAEIVVNNGSFEDPTVGAGGYELALPTGWSLSPNATADPAVVQPAVDPIYPTTSYGSQILALEGQYNNWTSGPWIVNGVQQDLGEMKAGETYTFGAILSSCSGSARCYYKIGFYDAADGHELNSIDETDYDPSALGSLQTLPATFSYTATFADANHGLRLIMESTNQGTYFSVANGALTGYCNRTGIDNVTVTTVPEPAACVTLLCGVSGLLAYAWRRRK